MEKLFVLFHSTLNIELKLCLELLRQLFSKDIEINILTNPYDEGSKGSLSMEINNEVQIEKQEDVLKFS